MLSIHTEDRRVALCNKVISDYFEPIKFSVAILLSHKDTQTTIDSTGAETTNAEAIQEDAIGLFAHDRLGRTIYVLNIFFENLMMEEDESFFLNFINPGLILLFSVKSTFK